MKRRRNGTAFEGNPKKRLKRYKELSENDGKTDLEREMEKYQSWESKQENMVVDRDVTGFKSDVGYKKFHSENDKVKSITKILSEAKQSTSSQDAPRRRRRKHKKFQKKKIFHSDEENEESSSDEEDISKLPKIELSKLEESQVKSLCNSIKQFVITRQFIRSVLPYDEEFIDKILRNTLVRYVSGTDKNSFNHYKIGYITGIISEELSSDDEYERFKGSIENFRMRKNENAENEKNAEKGGYDVDGKWTNYIMVLNIDGINRKCRMDKISNSSITEREFLKFYKSLKFNSQRKKRKIAMNSQKILNNLHAEWHRKKRASVNDLIDKHNKDILHKKYESYIKNENYNKLPLKKLKDMYIELKFKQQMFIQDNEFGEGDPDIGRKMTKINDVINEKKKGSVVGGSRVEKINMINMKRNMERKKLLRKKKKKKNVSTNNEFEDDVFKRKTTKSNFFLSNITEKDDVATPVIVRKKKEVVKEKVKVKVKVMSEKEIHEQVDVKLMDGLLDELEDIDLVI